MRKSIRFSLIVMVFLSLMFISCPVFAIPDLQIYIPGATYDTSTETWIINSYDYDLWVIGANVELFDVKFAAAVPADENGSISVTWLQGQLLDENGNVVKEPYYSSILGEGDYGSDPYLTFCDFGTPLMGNGDPVPPHGVFPASYYEYVIGDFGLYTDGQEIQNYIPGDEWGNVPKKGGEIKKFGILVEGYSWVDIIAYGYYVKKNGKAQYVKTPFSHDGEGGGTPTPIPEPSTYLLFLFGLIGIIGLKKKLN